MDLVRQVVGQGLNTFCLQGGGCGNRRLPGWWEWPGTRLKWGVQRYHMLYADKRTAMGSSPALQRRQPFPGLCSDGVGLYVPFHSTEMRSTCPGLYSFLAMSFTVVIPSSKWTVPHPLTASGLSCFIRIILLIASVKKNQAGREVDLLC